jgi:SAM-dependent methyltransferase
MAENQITGQRACPLCGAAPQACWPVLKREQFQIVECSECGMVFLANGEQQARECDWNEGYLRERARRKREHPVWVFFSGLTRPLKPALADRLLAQTLRWRQSGRLLDVGCGDGAYLEKAARHCEVMGGEISPLHFRWARQRVPRVEILLGGITEVALPENSFDLITQFSFLEHEWHPLAALRVVCRCLKPAGITILKVPNYSSWNRRVMGQAWSGYRFPEHCNYFTPRTLSAMLARAGLRPLRGSLLDRLPTSDSLWMAAEK